jgi:hypothetical protein
MLIAQLPAPNAHDLYVSAIRAMADLPQPSYVTYRIIGENDGMQVGLTVIGGNLWLSIGAGSDESNWSVQHRTFDYKSIVTDESTGKTYRTARSFFDPTWYGTERALRLGMLNSQDAAAPHEARVDPTPPPGPTLRTIAVTTVLSPSIYNVEDRGPATCSNGDAGRALHLWSREHNVMHQLSDVTIDLSSMRFCTMRYSIADTFGYHGIVEQHFADVGGFWMETDGLLDGTVRFMGFATHHGIWRYRLTDMQFPPALSI